MVAAKTTGTVVGRAREELFAIPSEGEELVASNMSGLSTGLEGKVLVPRPYVAGPARRLLVLPDGNRGAILPETVIGLWGRSFVLGVKGVGARTPMYDAGMPETAEPVFGSESWFGENPWGSMGQSACLEDKEITELSGPQGIDGFHICPMVRACPLPPDVMERARGRYWYRRYGGQPYYQQQRLLPSDVRLYYQSETTIGHRPGAVLEAFGVLDPEALDGFLDHYIRSGLAALTLLSRSLRGSGRDRRALDYQDVWLDKDSVLAPDGTLFFADIEGLAWVPVQDDERLAALTRRQFERNFYEFMYGLHRLLGERDQMAGRMPSAECRRADVAARLELSLQRDRFIRLERSARSLDMLCGGALVRLLDFTEEKA